MRGELLATIEHEREVTQLAWSFDGQTLYTAGRGKVIRAWSID